MSIALTVWYISVAVTIATFTIILLVLLVKDPRFIHKKKKGINQQKINEAKDIIISAQTKASKIIEEANVFNHEVSSQITRSLKEVSQAAKNKTEKIGQNITNEASQQLNSIVEKHNEKWQKTLDSYETLTQKQLAEFREKLAATIKQELSSARQSISKYRTKEEKRITKELEEQMPELIKKLAGRSIPIKIHEDMVREALAKARQDSILRQ